MRNWNLASKYFRIILDNRFQPTYEELKLQKIYFHLWKKISFQPTYEELKQYIV